MGTVRKSLCLLLVVMLAPVSLLAVQPSYAQSVSKPSVPEFTAEFVDRSYTVPARTYTDPYTGEQVTSLSYVIQNETIEITIKNQPFVSSEEIAYLCYNIREKGYFEDTWIELFHITNKTNDNALIRASNSDYTIISLASPALNGGQIDFQVKAYFTVGHRLFGSASSNFGYWTWEESNWGNTQTVTVPSADSSPSPSPTVPELPWFTLLPVCLLVLFAALVLKSKKLSYALPSTERTWAHLRVL